MNYNISIECEGGCIYRSKYYGTSSEAISAHNAIARAVQYTKLRAEAMDADARQVLGL
jgi:hypothetical protein